MCLFFHPPPKSSSLEEDLVASLRICSVRHFEFTVTSLRVYYHVIARPAGPWQSPPLYVYVFKFLCRTEVAADEDLPVDSILTHVELHDVR